MIAETTNQELINENISLKCIIALKDIQIERLKGKTRLREISEKYLKVFEKNDEPMQRLY